MPKGKQGSEPPKRDQVIELISAVASGDAAREDIVASLKDKGIDSLDVLVEVLAQATRKGKRVPPVHIDPQQLSNPSPPKRTSETVHRAPSLPFLLRGKLYDPPDIQRFNGQELHFISAPDRDYLVVIDDRAIMENWWQLTYISANSSYHPNKVLAPDGSGSVGITDYPPFVIAGSGGTGSTGPEGFSGIPGPPAPEPHTNFYEDVNYGGSRLVLKPNEGKPDLTEESWTIFGTGDWNDTISSIQMIATSVATLYEHVNWAGSTFSTTQSTPNLGGFNDAASGCATW